MATSNGPCLRVSHGSVPVSAKLVGGSIAGVALGRREDHRAEGRRRQEHHLSIDEMRREQACDIALREGRRRAQDQLGAVDGFGNVSRHQRQLHVVPAIGVLEDNARAGCAMLRHLCRIAPPQADLVALQREIARGRERAVAAAQHRDLQGVSPSRAGLVELPQHEMLDLAQRRSRQIIDKDDIARHLEAGELRQHMRFQILGFDRTSRAPDHVGHRHLVPSGIGPADHAALRDIGMLQQHAFDFGRIDVFATGNDQILLAVVHPEITIGVAQADVAGAIPAVVQRLPGRFLVAPIFREYVGAAHRDFPGRVRRQFDAGIIDHSRLAAQTGKAGRARARKIAAEARIDCDRAGFGRAVDLKHRHPARDKAIDQMRRHDRRSGRDCLQGGKVGGEPVGMVGHRLNDRRHQHRQGRTIACDGGERCIRREARMNRHGGAMMQRRRGLYVEAADVKEGQHGEYMVVRR